MKSGRHHGGKHVVHHHGAKEVHHHHMKRGGGAEGREDPDASHDVYEGKESNVEKEAMGARRARGGGMEKGKHTIHHHGAKEVHHHHMKRGGGAEEHKSEGDMARRRHDRPGRKRGGGVGSDMRPLTSASKTRDAMGHMADEPESVE